MVDISSTEARYNFNKAIELVAILSLESAVFSSILTKRILKGEHPTEALIYAVRTMFGRNIRDEHIMTTLLWARQLPQTKMYKELLSRPKKKS